MSFFGRMFAKKKDETPEAPAKSASQQKVVVKSTSSRTLKSNPIAESPSVSTTTIPATGNPTQSSTPKLSPSKDAVNKSKRTLPVINDQEVMPAESMKALVKIQRFAKKVIIQKENEDEENWKVSLYKMIHEFPICFLYF